MYVDPKDAEPVFCDNLMVRHTKECAYSRAETDRVCWGECRQTTEEKK